ncbi:peptidase S41 family protein [Rutstroemia sp. NJR-2017a BBW]|nr:peptidase S41 family protein [Rutstroemia sp. NJR-2017a BBW]
MGGRSQFGPMQGVAGSKGAEVLRYLDIDTFYAEIPSLIVNLTQSAPPSLNQNTSLPLNLTQPTPLNQSLNLPSPPPASLLPPGPLLSWPLGNSSTQAASSRFNLRNNMPTNSSSSTPLQFIYESSNCRLFYLQSDLYRIEGLWSRVHDVVWGNGSCVQGSTVTDGDAFPGNAGDTVGYDSGVDSKVRLGGQPGLVGGGNGNGTVSGEGSRGTTLAGTKTMSGVSTAVAVNGTVYTAGFVAATSTMASATVLGQASATGAGTAAQFTNGAGDIARGEMGKLVGLVGAVALGMMV